MERPVKVKGEVLENIKISPSCAHLVVKTEGVPTYKAGQFAWLTLEKEGKKIKRPYSIASAPWDTHMAFCIKRVQGGEVSNALCDLEAGEEIQVFSPLGLFVLPQEHEDITFICLGTGLAPFRGMIRELFEKHYNNTGNDTTKNITLLFGTRNDDEVLYEEEFKPLAAAKENFNYFITLSREEKEGYLQGRVQEHLDKLQLSEKSIVYICGINEMVLDVKKQLLAQGLTQKQLHVELYG